MKRLETVQSHRFLPLVLDLEGLREILTALEPAEEVKLVADGMEYDSVDELASHLLGKSPRELTVTARRPYLTVELSPTATRLFAGSNDLASYGMFARVAAVLSSAERSPRSLYKDFHVLLVFVGLQALSYVPIFKTFQLGLFCVMGLVISWYFWICFIQLRRHGLLLTHESKDGRSFYQRNADNIRLAVVSAILGAVLGAAATKLADRLMPTVQPEAAPHASTTLQPKA
ncbi:hypothetical protein KW830_05895 [Comamonas sp. CMM03]|uniref:hypothetical protein n=1 Tax=Comamonas sp. CMM03 TaxID=2854781 RepID=UPI001C4583F6|nr:hypothetical protein [Comamonas sp. CMM03]MBV7417986.1 hypothetical protein [Comamonas sp. CMM03]